MIPDLWSSKGESTTSKIGFYPGNMKELHNQFVSSGNDSHLKKLVCETCNVLLMTDTVAVGSCMV